MARRQRDQLHATGDKKRFGADQESLGLLFQERRKRHVDFAIRTGVDDFGLPPDGRSCCLQFRDKWPRDKRIVRIDEQCKARGSRQQLVQKREPLCSKLNTNVADPGGVAARAVKAGNETKFSRGQRRSRRR